MKARQSLHHPGQPKTKKWPLVSALTAAGLATAMLGGCALTERHTAPAGAAVPADIEVRALPLVAQGTKTPDAYYTLGKYYFYQGRLEQAREAFWDAVKLDHGHVDALNGLGAVYDRLGQFDLAQKAYEAALLKDPQAAHVWANLGYSLILAGKTGEAVAPLQKALALDPANGAARRHLADLGAKALPAAAATAGADEARNAAEPAAPVAPQGVVASVTTAKDQTAVVARPASVELAPAPVASLAATVQPVEPLPVRQAQAAAIPAIAKAEPKAVDIAASPVLHAAAAPTPPSARVAVVPAASPHAVGAPAAESRSPSIIASVDTPSPARQASVPAAAPAPGAADSGKGLPNAPEREAVAVPTTIPVASLGESGISGMLKGLRIEVSNGNGVTGMARAVGHGMRESGLNIARITNARPFDKPQTLIVCSPAMKPAAMELAQSMAVEPRIVMRDVSHRNVDVRVVLGADTALAWKDKSKAPYLIAGLGK